jgi:hypothetical protein
MSTTRGELSAASASVAERSRRADLPFFSLPSLQRHGSEEPVSEEDVALRTLGGATMDGPFP